MVENDLFLKLKLAFDNPALQKSLNSAKDVIRNTEFKLPVSLGGGVVNVGEQIDVLTEKLKEATTFTTRLIDNSEDGIKASSELGGIVKQAFNSLVEKVKEFNGATNESLSILWELYETWDKFHKAIFYLSVFSALDAATNALGVAAYAVYDSFSAVRKQLELVNTTDATTQLNDLYETTKTLGHTFLNVAQDFAKFQISLETASVAFDSQALFVGLTKISNGLGLAEAEASRFYEVIAEVVQEGFINFNNLNNRIGQDIPNAMASAVKAMQNLVDEGSISLEQLLPDFDKLSDLEKSNYKLTVNDLIDIENFDDLQSFLPNWIETISEDMDQGGTTIQGSLIRIANAFDTIRYAIGETMGFEMNLWLEGTAKAAEFLASNSAILVGIWEALFGFSVGMIGFGLIELTKSFGHLNQVINLLNLDLKTVAKLTVDFAKATVTSFTTQVLPKLKAFFAAASSGFDVFTIGLKVASKMTVNMLADLAIALAINPLTTILIGLTTAMIFAKPVFTELGNIAEGTSGKMLKLHDAINKTGAMFNDLNNKFNNGEILSTDLIDNQIQNVAASVNKSQNEIIAIKLKASSKGLEALTLEERMLLDQIKLLENLKLQNEIRIKQTKALKNSLFNIEIAFENINKKEKENILLRKELIASGSLSDSDAKMQALKDDLNFAKQRLYFARKNAIELDKLDISGLSADQREGYRKKVEENDKAIYENRIKVAELTVKLQEDTVQREIDITTEKLDTLDKQYRKAELSRRLMARQAYIDGTFDIEVEEKKRLKNKEILLREQFKFEKDEIARLNALLEQGVKPNQKTEIENELLKSMERQVEIMAEFAALELERQAELQRQVDLKAELIQGDIDEIQTKSELVQIAAELAKIQSDLDNARSEALQAQYSLALAYGAVEESRIQYEIDSVELLKDIDADRRDVIAERLGLESDGLKNAIELSRERENQEQHLQTLKENQLKVQQKAERQQLEADKLQLKYTIEQERYKLQALKLEQEIAKMKATQALSAAQANMQIAMSSGDTEAANKAELEILQARRELDLLNNSTIQEQEKALSKTAKAQNAILELREETLDATHEQQRTELELEQIVNARSRAIEIETKLIEEQTQAREQSRREALLALGYGTEAQKQAVNLQLELNQLQDTYARQAEYVADLEATGVLNSEEELILTEAQNDLNETRLSLLEVENQLIESQKIAREQNLKDALLALEYGTDAQKQASETINLQLELNRLQDVYAQQTQYIANLEASSLPYAEKNVLLSESKNELGEIRLNLLETEYRLEESLANEIAQEREASLQRQNEILENRKTLLEAELGLQQAQNDLEQAKLDRRLLEIDRKEGLGKIDPEQAAEARFKIERQKLEIEADMLQQQQKADLKRLEIEQQIEVMRLRASQAEAEVVRARAEASLAESKGALSRAIESDDQAAIDAANAAIDASEKGIEAATSQVDLIGEQIEQTLELQKIQLETIETQQKADQERIKNRERELEITREIAQYEAQQAQDAADEAEWNDTTGNRVSGGGVSAGNTYTVGEQGTELFHGVDGSTKLLGVKGQHAFTPNVPGKIISNQALEQVIAANVMRSDSAVVEAIQRGFKTSGNEFARLAGILTNRITKPAVITNNYGSSTPIFDVNKARLSRI